MYDLSNVLPDNLSREYILNRVSELEIFQYFIGENWEIDRKYRSTFRIDKKPTAMLYYTSQGRLNYRDFSGHFWGDCFGLVQFLYCCDFIESLKIIDFHLGVTGRKVEEYIPVKRELPKSIKQKTKKRGKASILCEYRKWRNEDVKYWTDQYGIGHKELKFFNVKPCKNIWVSNIHIYKDQTNNPAYEYMIKRCTGEKKIYFPYWPEVRFRCNTTIMQGWEQLPASGDLCIITKSMKDIIYLYSHGYIAVAPQGEGNDLPEKKINELKKRFNKVITLFDNDSAGSAAAWKAYLNNGLLYQFIPSCSYAKDPTDFHAKYGALESQKLLNRLFHE